MTANRLAVAVTALMMLVGLSIPALAGARGSGRRSGERQRLEKHHPRSASPAGCKLSIQAQPRTLTAGEAPQVFGRLHCPGAAAAAQTVTLYGHSVGQPNQPVGTTTTDPGGYFTLVAPAPSTDTLYYVTAVGATSASKAVKVAPAVTIQGPAETASLLTGVRSRVTFSGTVSPVDVGAEVVLQREQAVAVEEWHAIQRGVVGRHGEYSFVHVFKIPGDANIRVVVRPHRRFSAFGASTPLSYVISQRQNPALTLLATGSGASNDPILFAQTVTLHGVLAGGWRPDHHPPGAQQAGPVRDNCHDHRRLGRQIQLRAGPAGKHRLQGARRRPPLGGAVRGRQIRAHGGRLGRHRAGRADADLRGHGDALPPRTRGLPRAPERQRRRLPRGRPGHPDARPRGHRYVLDHPRRSSAWASRSCGSRFPATRPTRAWPAPPSRSK